MTDSISTDAAEKRRVTPQPGVVALASAEQLRSRLRRKSKLKGRQPDDASLAEVRALIGPGPHRRDLLIEHLHRLNDTWRGLHERHLVALAQQMKLPMAEVYEVATFYHHFEVLRGDEQPRRRSPCACATAWPARWPARRTCWRGCRRCSAPTCA